MRKYLGLPNTADIQQGDAIPLDLVKINSISGSGATVTLTAAQSGSTALFDRAAGIVYTLPAPEVGLLYKFFVSTTITSNAAKIITNAATVYLLGNVLSNTVGATPAAADGPKTFAGNGTTHIAISMSGTTTGGIIGTWVECECISSTLWAVRGVVCASGTIATPFSTS
jgi:hypothetical protein